jgi:hypothetical protein
MTLPALDLYWLAMQSWELDEFKQAAVHLLSNCQFMPTPYDFEQLRKAGRPSAAEAWAKVLDLVRHSNYANGSGDALIDRAVSACGGYRLVGQQSDDSLPFMERRFAEHFETLQDAEHTRSAVPSITAQQYLKQLVKK